MRLQLIDDPAALDELGAILGGGDRVRFLSSVMHREMMSEIRWTSADTARTRDGLDVATLELNASDAAGMRITASWRVMELVAAHGGGRSLEKPSRTAIAASAAVGLVSVAGTTPADYLAGGRALARVWLTATARGWALQPMTAILYLWARLERGGGEGLSATERRELEALRARFARVFDVDPARGEILLFRIAQAGPPTARSLRRPVEDVLTIE